MNLTARHPLRTCLLMMFLLAWLPAAHAGIATAPGADLEVSLLTYGPGQVYWERFGHTSIEIRDRASGQAVTFNYGVFDFSQKNFLRNFAYGTPHYTIDAELAHEEIAHYIRHGRFVRRQRLAVTPREAAMLRNYLLWNLQPGNRGYIYRYYIHNCTTKARDALNLALGGALKAALQQPSNDITYRRETDRLMSGKPWLMLFMDLGLSGYADQPLNQWQAAFIPMQLAHEINHVRVPDGHGGTRPLVASNQLVAAARLPAAPREPPNLIPPLLIAGLILGLLLALAGHYRHTHGAARAGFAALGTLWLLFAGIIGITLAAIWAFTLQYAGWANENLLLFSPLALVLIAGVWRRTPSRLSRYLVLLLTAAALFALLAKVLPGFNQQNLPWICFGLPPWLAMTYSVYWRRMPVGTHPVGDGISASFET